MPGYKIILADDHAIFRAGLKSLIAQEEGLRVVGEAQNGEDLLEQLKSLRCDLIVLDLSMPELDGMTAIKMIRAKYPKIKILILTMQKDGLHFKRAMTSGASGYLLKDDAYDQLLLAIRLILKGKRFISPSVSALMTERFLRSQDEAQNSALDILTKREKQILELITSGLANKNIAARLKISIRTVEAHRINLTGKLGIKSTAGLVKYAISRGLS